MQQFAFAISCLLAWNMSKEQHPLRKLAESILYVFTLPEREAYIDENHGYITKYESEKRIFKCNLGFNVCLQVVIIVLLTLHFSFWDDVTQKQIYLSKCQV